MKTLKTVNAALIPESGGNNDQYYYMPEIALFNYYLPRKTVHAVKY